MGLAISFISGNAFIPHIQFHIKTKVWISISSPEVNYVFLKLGVECRGKFWMLGVEHFLPSMSGVGWKKLAMSGVGITPFIGPNCVVLAWHAGCQFFTRISDTKTHKNQILGKLDTCTRFPFRNPELLKDFQKANFLGWLSKWKTKRFS